MKEWSVYIGRNVRIVAIRPGLQDSWKWPTSGPRYFSADPVNRPNRYLFRRSRFWLLQKYGMPTRSFGLLDPGAFPVPDPLCQSETLVFSEWRVTQELTAKLERRQ